jgi:signal recognition particle subunit SRP54
MRRKATKSPKNKRKGTKGGGRPRSGGGGLPAGLPGLPPGFDPSALDPNAGLPPGVTLPKIDFSKFGKRDGKNEQ